MHFAIVLVFVDNENNHTNYKKMITRNHKGNRQTSSAHYVQGVHCFVSDLKCRALVRPIKPSGAG